MAYKFQRGDAIFSGSLTQVGNISAEDDISGSNICVVGSTLSAGDDILINTGDLIVSGTATHGLDLFAANGRSAISASADKHVQVSVKNTDDEVVLKMGAAGFVAGDGTADAGFLRLYADGGTTVQAHFSGSGAGQAISLTMKEDLEVGGNVTVAGNLTVSGTETQIQSSFVKIGDHVAQIASTATNIATSTDSGFKVGTQTNNIGQLLLKPGTFDSGVSESVFFGVFGNTVATNDYIDIEADKFYGDGSNLSNVPSTTAVQLKADGGTLEVGVNYVTAAGSTQTLTLPAASGLSTGQVIKVKSYGAHSSTNKIVIKRSGGDTIDGQSSIELVSAFASITLIKTSASGFSII